MAEALLTQNMRLHATSLTDLLVCPRLYKYAHVLRLRSPVPSEKLDAGGITHLALADFYTNGDVEAALQVFEDACVAATTKLQVRINGDAFEEVNAKIEKERAVCRKTLAAYLPWAQEHDKGWWANVLHVEQKFDVPVLDYGTGQPLVYGGAEVHHVGTFDLVVEDSFGFVWIVDHKTAKSFPSDIEMHLNLQFGLYTLAAHQLFPERTVAGVIYNGIKKVDPAKAKTPTHHRVHLRKTEAQLATLGERLSAVLVPQACGQRHDPHPGAHCGWRCPYTGLCLAEERDDDWQYLATANFEVAPDESPTDDDDDDN